MIEPLKDKRSLALQLRDRLRQMMRERFYRIGDQLPSEEALSQMFAVSRATVREALKLLEEEKVINVRHGLGRFVAFDPNALISEDITRLESVTEMAQNLGFALETEVLAFQAESPTQEVAAHLNLTPAEGVYVLKRIRKAAGEIIIYSIDIFPQSLAPEPLHPADFRGSLLALMENAWGTPRLAYTRATLSAVRADDELPALPGIDRAVPWLLMEQINFIQNDRPILFSRDFHRSDKFRFHVLRRRR
jgi:GntR family transcriptional regulator